MRTEKLVIGFEVFVLVAVMTWAFCVEKKRYDETVNIDASPLYVGHGKYVAPDTFKGGPR